MPRKPRVEFPGAFYHVICRGNNRQNIFIEEDDYKEFLKSVQITKTRYGFILYCYNLLPNHLHLAIKTIKEPLSRVMCSLLTRYARYFNIKYKRTGHVLEKRYKGILCQKENYLLEMVRYIHLNDVRADLVNRLGDWEWSSYRAYIGAVQDDIVDTNEVLSIFDKNISVARKKFAEFVYDGTGMKHTEKFYPPDAFPYLGDTEFVEDLSNKHGEVRRKNQPKIRASLIQLAEKISMKTNISISEMRSSCKSKKISLARKIFSVVAVYHAGYKASRVAQFLNCSLPAISVYLRNARINISDKKTIEEIGNELQNG